MAIVYKKMKSQSGLCLEHCQSMAIAHHCFSQGPSCGPCAMDPGDISIKALWEAVARGEILKSLWGSFVPLANLPSLLQR